MSALMMKKLAADAMAVQDACNLTGVVYGFARACDRLREAMAEAGEPAHMEAVNTHPIVMMWVDKLCHLAKMQPHHADALERYSAAYDYCQRHIIGGTP